MLHAIFGGGFLSTKIITAIYAAPLLVGAVFDFWTYRIPNVVTGTFALLYFACALKWGVDVNWLSHLGACAAVLIVGLGLFYFGIFGGGDIKLIAAVALWLGLNRELVLFLAVAGLFGGALTVLLLGLRYGLSRVPLPFPAYWPESVMRTKAPIPYGVAVVGGALWVASSIPFLLS